ncbi:MAG TPA: nidogen-like domain-containing protein [Bacteroidia bacterium]
MRKIYVIVSLALTMNAFAQYKLLDKIQSDNYHKLKKEDKLTGKELFYNPTGSTTSLIISHPSKEGARINKSSQVMSAGSCNCWIPRDTSFHVVPFSGYSQPNYSNDDGYTAAMTLPFNFCLYGDTVGTSTNPMFINNNGNISFGSPYSTYSPVGFPATTYTMIAPFWGDVDTENPPTNGGVVWYKQTPTYLIIQWDSVGVFDHSTPAQINTFQLIITNGIDSILPPENNISFCYGEMQWTTGDASNGAGTGFGGYPATVGINKGDGINYFQISLFNNGGSVYTNLTGTPPSGINWLTGRSFYFNSCGTGTNLPPIALDSAVCDTLTLYAVGDSLVQRIGFIPPEANQMVTMSAVAPSLGSAFSVVNSTSGANAYLTFKVINSGLAIGYYNVTITGTDNIGHPLSTNKKYVVHILTSGTTGIKQTTSNSNQVVIYPNPNNGTFVIETNATTKQALQVYDVNGKMVLSQTINGKTIIDASSLNEGVYNISIISNEGMVNKSLVIVR